MASNNPDDELLIDMSDIDTPLEFKCIHTSFGCAVAILKEWYGKNLTFDISAHLIRDKTSAVPFVSVCLHFLPECRDEVLALIAKYTEYGV